MSQMTLLGGLRVKELHDSVERFSVGFHKTKTKGITLANHKGHGRSSVWCGKYV